ncbi:MAG: branched-chain amino acid ABC transporter ATP-binding protein/permease [Casimicrobiaceae bacterium]
MSRSGWGSGIAAVFLAVAMLSIPLAGNAYLTTFAFTVLISFVLAQSWDWVAGEMGYINLGHFVFYGFGAYTFCILLTRGMPLAVCFAATLVVGIGVAVMLAFPLFRLREDYFAFATLALVPLAELLAYNLDSLTNGAIGLSLPPVYVLQPAYYIASGLVVVTALVTLLLRRSRFGYALRGIRNDEQAAEIVGVRIWPDKLSVLALSAAFAALAGAIQAWQMSYIDPPTVFGLNVALIPIAMALFGGSGLAWGPLVGVLLLATAQQWLIAHVQMLQATIYGLAILLIGRFMPGGLLRARWLVRIPGLGAPRQESVPASTASGASLQPATAELPLPRRSARRGSTLLECRDVTMAFGGNVAVNGVNLVIMEGEIVGLVGSNGSGKTTLFNCISKVYEPLRGDILLGGASLNGLRRDQVSNRGVGRTYQIPRPFSDLTVRENIAMPLMFRASGCLHRNRALAEAERFAGFSGLTRRIDTIAGALSLQEKKALEFARALACQPRLLLVDEVASGLTPAEVVRFVEHIREIRDTYGVTVIWIEHIFSALSRIVDRLVVMDNGTIIADGPLVEVVRDERVLKSYLGSVAERAA